MRTKNQIKRGGAFALVEMLMIICIVALFAALAIPKCQAQEGGWPLQNNIIPIGGTGLPAVIPSANDPTNLASPVVLDLGKTKIITPSFTESSSVNATNVLFKGAWSNDGVNFDTNNLVSMVAYANASIPVTTCTNSITGNGRRYFEILYESGAGGGIITNGPASYDTTGSPY
jgi:hypothetical protein